MSNPAKYLYDFFTLPGNEQHLMPVRPLLHAVNLIEDSIATLERTGASMRPFAELPPLSREHIIGRSDKALNQIETQYFDQNMRKQHSVCTLPKSDLHLLYLLSEKIETQQFVTDSTKKSISDFIAEVKDLVQKDDSLDPELRLFIGRTLLAIEHELLNFEVSGDFILREALLTLFGLLRVAEETSSVADEWKTVWSEWGKPITQGIIVSLPQIAVGLGNLLAISS